MSSIKLTADSGGGTFEIKAPASGSNARVLTIPDSANSTIVTTTKPAAGSVVQVLEFTGGEENISGGLTTAKINLTFNPLFSGSKFTTFLMVPGITGSSSDNDVRFEVYLGTSATPASNTKVIDIRESLAGTDAKDNVVCSGVDYGSFTCSGTGTHYAALNVTTNTGVNTIVGRHSQIIKIVLQEIAQ